MERERLGGGVPPLSSLSLPISSAVSLVPSSPLLLFSSASSLSLDVDDRRECFCEPRMQTGEKTERKLYHEWGSRGGGVTTIEWSLGEIL